MYYTIYKITNLNNGKTYIGKHKTNNLDDGYMGSGKLIRRAVKKHGLENFKKEILFIFDNEDEMNAKEKELVIVSEETYNLCPGGEGGFGYLNNHPDKKKWVSGRGDKKSAGLKRKIENDECFRKKLLEQVEKAIEASKKINRFGANNSFYGKSHSEENKKRISKLMSEKYKGSNNPQFGTCWITDGTGNKKVRKEELDNWLSLGYRRGRTL